MLSLALDLTTIMLAVAIVLAACRLAIGPSLPDRILALDTLYVNTVAVAVLTGIRYDTSRASIADVTAPPYDVIDARGRAALVARDPHNVVLVDLPDEADGPGRYEAAARTFDTWLAEGVLRRDEEPGFYVYRMDYLDDLGRQVHTLGVLGALELSRPDEGESPLDKPLRRGSRGHHTPRSGQEVEPGEARALRAGHRPPLTSASRLSCSSRQAGQPSRWARSPGTAASASLPAASSST